MHSAHRCTDDPLHDGCRRQLESEALTGHDALRHCDAHDALRRVDLHLAWGEERAAAQNAHDSCHDALGSLPGRPQPPERTERHGLGRSGPGLLWPALLTRQPTAGPHALRHLHLHLAPHRCHRCRHSGSFLCVRLCFKGDNCGPHFYVS